MIEGAKYNQYGNIEALIEGEMLSIPDDIRNRHRQMLKEWEDEGHIIDGYDGDGN